MPDTVTCPKCRCILQRPENGGPLAVCCPKCNAEFEIQPITFDDPVSDTNAVREELERETENQSVSDAGPRRPSRKKRTSGRPMLARMPAGRQRSTMSTIIGILIACGAFALFYLPQILRDAREPRRPHIPVVQQQEDAEQRRLEMIEAFRKQDPLAEDEILAEIKPVFRGLGKAYQARDGQRILAYFDVDRLFDELITMNIFPDDAARQRVNIVQRMETRLAPAMARNAPLMQWTSFDIRHLKKLQGNEVVVIVRHEGNDGIILKMRWWLTKRPGEWKIYDWEDLDIGIRMTTTVSAIAAHGFGRARELAEAAKHIQSAIMALGLQQNPNLAEQHLRKVGNVALPDRMEALRLFAVATLNIHRGRFKESLKSLDKAHKLNSEMIFVDYMKGIAFNGLSQWNKARHHLEKYRMLLGDDAELCAQIGIALSNLRRFPEACVEYRKSLDYFPDDPQIFLNLIRALTDDADHDDIGARFAKLTQRKEAFELCAEDCRQARQGRALEILATTMKRLEPKYLAADYYLSLGKIWNKKSDEGVKIFQSALTEQNDPQTKRVWTQDFLQAMADVQKALQAYKAAPAPKEAFAVLAARLKTQFLNEDLVKLVALHGKSHPGDRLVPFYEGEIYVQQRKYELADKAFIKGMSNPPDQQTLDQFRPSRVLAKYHKGNILAAYKDIEPREATFIQLASLCFINKKYEELSKLLDAHSKNAPDDPLIAEYRYRIKISQNQIKAAVGLFQAALGKVSDKVKRERMTSNFLLDMLDVGKMMDGFHAVEDRSYAFRVLAGDLHDQLDTDRLQKLIDAYRRTHPQDDWLHYYGAVLHLDNKAWDKAAGAFETLWEKADDNIKNLARFRFVFALYKTGRGLEAYEKSAERKATFEQLARLFVLDKNGDGLAELIKAHRPHAGAAPELMYYEARLKFLQKRPIEGVAFLKKAYETQIQEYKRKQYIRDVIHSEQDGQRGLQAYRIVPDKRTAFETLADIFVREKDAKNLETLIAEHAKNEPDDPVQFEYLGELHLLRGQAKQALKYFKQAHDAARPNQDWKSRKGIIRAYLALGQAIEAYHDLGSDKRSFQDVAAECANQKKPEQLQKLTGVYRKSNPNDPDLRAWQLELDWLNGNDDAAIKLILSNRDDMLGPSTYRWKCESYLIRCLVRKNRLKEAIREADAIVKDNGNRILLVLAHAASGDVEKTMELVKKYSVNEYFVEDCYRDDDLGPILRSESFAAFRKQFPEPKKE